MGNQVALNLIGLNFIDRNFKVETGEKFRDSSFPDKFYPQAVNAKH